jgi:asparagine synthetase B (glutamine-hydrolysing)
MCGIHASISTSGPQPPSSGLKLLLCNRGPDHLGGAQAELQKDGETIWVSFTSTVLALRGGHVQIQPFVDRQNGSVLCWNGEAWRVDSNPVIGNDGQRVFEALLKASSQKLSLNSNAAVLEVLRSISGPFAFAFLDKIHGHIFFGRDRLGRRSLLYNTESLHGCMEFASTSDPGSLCWKEVEADAIYQLSCSDESGSQRSDDHLTTTSLLPLQRHPWIPGDLTFSVSGPIFSLHTLLCILAAQQELRHSHTDCQQSSLLGDFNRSVPSEAHNLNTHAASVELLKNHLYESLKLRILNIPIPPGLNETQNVRIAILFSGGLDCTVLARMAHDLLPQDQHIDLINVAFENPRVVAAAKETPKAKKQIQKGSDVNADGTEQNGIAVPHWESAELSPYESCPDRETGRISFQELQDVCPGRVWRFIAACLCLVFVSF